MALSYDAVIILIMNKITPIPKVVINNLYQFAEFMIEQSLEAKYNIYEDLRYIIFLFF